MTVDTRRRAPETIVDALSRHAMERPTRVAYRFLKDSVVVDEMRFGELHERVMRSAGALRAHCASSERALLLFPPGLEFVVAFLGTLAAGSIAVPAPLPRRHTSLERLLATFASSQPSVVVTSEDSMAAVSDALRREAPNVGLVSTFEPGGLAVPRTDAPICDVAFLQYTSGSTAEPRGVIVSHENLICNLQQIERHFGLNPDSKLVSWLPLFHDMGLVGCVLAPLYVGCEATLLSPLDFMYRPASWLEAITQVRATVSGAPNFAYDHCARMITEEQKRRIDLRSIEVAFNASEAIAVSTMERFQEAFGECGFREQAMFPAYGLAEATVFVSGGPVLTAPRHVRLCRKALADQRVVLSESEEARSVVGCGAVAQGTDVRIVNPNTNELCAPDAIGEIWVSSGSVARGYWNNPEASAGTFDATIVNDGARKYLRTGDMGFMRGGEIFVLGRVKDVIAIRGRKVYPEDIEQSVVQALGLTRPNSVAACHSRSDIGDGVALLVEDDDSAVMCRDRTALAKVRDVVGAKFEVSVHAFVVVPKGAFPRTSSGKVRRNACSSMISEGCLRQ